MIYIFDVDGTLTPSRGKIHPEFKEYLKKFIQDHRTWIITGSDQKKTKEQLGADLWESIERIYQCSGNELHTYGKKLYSKKPIKEYYLEQLLESYVNDSKYPFKFGNHIEMRPGTVNFSTIGRNCNQDQRDKYYKWDLETKERQNIVYNINQRYPWFEAVVGGEISIDIFKRGFNKGQIIKEVVKIGENFHFFGDKIYKGGNDYSIKETAEELKLEDYKLTSVTNYRETWEKLTNIY